MTGYKQTFSQGPEVRGGATPTFGLSDPPQRLEDQTFLEERLGPGSCPKYREGPDRGGLIYNKGRRDQPRYYQSGLHGRVG